MNTVHHLSSIRRPLVAKMVQWQLLEYRYVKLNSDGSLGLVTGLVVMVQW